MNIENENDNNNDFQDNIKYLLDETNRDKLVDDENGVKTLPQLFDEGKYVGGFDSVLNILRNSLNNMQEVTNKYDLDKLTQ